MSAVLETLVADAMADMMAKKKAPTTKVTTPTPVAPPVAPTVVVSGDADMFSGVFGVPKNFPDFPIRMCDDIPTDFVRHVPKIDTSYVVQVEEAARLVAGIMSGDKILMTGPTGSGKSSLVKYVCAKLGFPFIRINMSADIESSALFGQLVVRDGATVWEDGPITEAVKHGAVCLIDEWELMPPEIAMGLQNLLEDDGYLYLKEKPGSSAEKTYMPHKNFRIICAGNTLGQGDDSGGFSGTMVQNSATLDRFQTTIVLDYLSNEHEIALLTGKTGVTETVAKGIVKFAGLVRSSYKQGGINLTMSPRTMLNWARKSGQMGTCLAFRVSWYDKLRESDKGVVSPLFEKVFSVKP